jgi:hypothetical protein
MRIHVETSAYLGNGHRSGSLVESRCRAKQAMLAIEVMHQSSDVVAIRNDASGAVTGNSMP